MTRRAFAAYSLLIVLSLVWFILAFLSFVSSGHGLSPRLLVFAIPAVGMITVLFLAARRAGLDAESIWEEFGDNGVGAMIAGSAMAALGAWATARSPRFYYGAIGVGLATFLIGLGRLARSLFSADTLGFEDRFRHAPLLAALLGVLGLEAGALATIW